LTDEADEDAPDRLLRNAPELQHHYWRGCNLLEKRTATALATAVDQFEAALRIDGDNVPSLIALARSHMLIAEHWYAPTCYAFSKAKAAIVRALELDPASGEAQAVLGDILLHCDWNWVEAERHIETAVEISPKSSVVNATAAWFYVCKGDREQALRRTQRVSLIESSSPSLQLFLARIFLHTGDLPRAIEVLSNLIESRSDFSIARRYRAQAYILSGRPGEALTDLLLLPQERADDIAQRLPLLARAYADCGDRERAESIYRSLLDLAATEYIAGFNLATVAVGLGRHDEALDHLSWALQRREAALLMLRSLTWFEPIARHARFRTLLRTIWPGEPVAKIRS
jgi:tetratricopeptide (TPR) repeat protein